MYKKLNSDTSNAEADQKPNLDSDFINHHFPSTLKMVYKSIQDKHSKRTSVNFMPVEKDNDESSSEKSSNDRK